jgi:hypothetical protein
MALSQDNELHLVIIGVALFAACQAIFVFSDYYPSSYGFENRTQGAIRFAASFLLVSVIMYILYHLRNEILKIWISLVSAAVFCFFGMSVAGQGQAWIAAARFNEIMLARIQNTMTQIDLFHD